MCCTRLAANTGRKKVAKNCHLGTIAQLCRAISLQVRHVSTIGKKLSTSNMSSTCPHNMVNFGPLAAEIVSLVWGTSANFNGFHVLAALLHGTLVVGVSQTLRRWTEGATYIRQGGHHVGHWPTFLVVLVLATLEYSRSPLVQHVMLIVLQLQKTWRGYRSRKYVFNFYRRRQYFSELERKNSAIRFSLFRVFCALN